MNQALVLAGVAAAAYLLGSIPTGLLLARRRGVDIREQGSGNIGATNVARTLGRKLGAVVLVLDAAKGALATLAAAALHHHHGVTAWAITAAGVAAVAGHCFPIWLRLRGGKGVATALGVMLVAAPLATGAAVLIFLALYATFRVVSIGSMAACAAMPLLAWLLGRPAPVIAAAGAIAAMVLVRHQGNLRRLLAGRENRL
ncbi:MAG TPA: glycerol-3-phosphate 1-O-acyltransferase PlsY [Kofleriaceae bacterium]|nr:glycerol-3-phosphate 1-O-acyltransferase PlsY [Kofleriaceae bacterium]